ncbi:hypothetical protein T484DRAFT_1949309 [Baffinella frigidus]|nr:hypothetical protein T484DRAFT_1949309 [Cryptophyta sp. CCMP2293]
MQSTMPCAPECTTHIGARVNGHNEHWTAAEVERLPCPTSLRIGDKVWLSTRDAHIARRGKFTPTYLGPFSVTLVDEAYKTCQLILPCNITNEKFRFNQLRISPRTVISRSPSASSCEQDDEVTPCITDRSLSNEDFSQHPALHATPYIQHDEASSYSMAGPSKLERSKSRDSASAEDSEDISNNTPFPTMEIPRLPRLWNSQETAAAINDAEEALEILALPRPAQDEEHWCAVLDRLWPADKSLPLGKVEEMQDPDHRVLSSFKVLLDVSR